MEYIHQTQYYETDQMGIIHHSNYIRWMEEARLCYMDSVGFPYTKVEDAGIISPVMGVECNYKSMTRYPERIVIEVKITKFNGIKYEISYVMRDEKNGEIKAEGVSRHCFLKKDGHPCSVKKDLPVLYEKMLGLLEEET